MADTISNSEDMDITPQSAAAAKMTSSGADFVAPLPAEHTTDVSGEVIDGIGGAGLVTTNSMSDDNPFGDADAPVPATPSSSAGEMKDQVMQTVGDAKDKAVQSVGDIKDQAVQKGQEALAQGKQAASQALEQGKEAAGQAFDQAKEQIVGQLDTRKDTLATTLEGAVQALQSTSQQFRDQNIPYVGEYAETFATQVEKASDYLRGKDVTELARDAEKFARANPIAFVGGAFVLGIALARFLKSSAEGSPLAFVQGTTPAPSSGVTALVPYNDSGTTLDTMDTTVSEGDSFGARPLSAHGYVAGVGSHGDNS